jgi:hypothetical protein
MYTRVKNDIPEIWKGPKACWFLSVCISENAESSDWVYESKMRKGKCCNYRPPTRIHGQWSIMQSSGSTFLTVTYHTHHQSQQLRGEFLYVNHVLKDGGGYLESKALAHLVEQIHFIVWQTGFLPGEEIMRFDLWQG